MRAYDIIAKKRDGGILTKEEISFMVNGYVEGRVPDYQMAAFLMAIFIRGMDKEEAYHLTMIMRDSGDIADLSFIDGIKVDKHSTGGVGDKTTLVVGPLVAALGLPVAKMSGRGLGHTGGTLDKLESIPGFKISLSKEEFEKQVKEIGLALIGQTGNIAPADKKIYALRDVTATIESIPLIAASIMSKKLASGADAFVLDVKVGRGAFMKTIDEAKELASFMVEIAKQNGKKAVAVLTDMDQPLGKMVGNALEVIEAIETLKGKGPKDFEELCLNIAAHMLVLGEKVASFDEAMEKLREVIANGKALEKFREMVKWQGGDEKVIEDYSIMGQAKNVYEFSLGKEGSIAQIDALAIGKASMVLGAGREKKEDEIDHTVGIEVLKKVGDKVGENECFLKLYYNDESKLERALEELKHVALVLEEEVKKPDLIIDVVK